MAINNSTPKYNCNTYLALGLDYARPLMKVGKTINVLNRQRGLRLKIELSCPCIDIAEGFQYEAEVRKVMRDCGALQINKRFDHYYFDLAIYQKVFAYFLDHAPRGNVVQYPVKYDKEDLEIQVLQFRYRVLLVEQSRRAS